MATKSRIVEKSFRIGCGRYLQENGALSRIGEEIRRLGCCRQFLLGGETALSLTRAAVSDSLAASGMTGTFYTFRGFCVPDHCSAITEQEDFAACDIVIGIGGGIVMDAAKLCAVMADRPVICVPTSSATCAACAPLSVTYNEIGQPLGTRHHTREVNAVIADMDILAAQPIRLFLSGVYDSLAKQMELCQRLLGKEESEIDIGLRASYELSRFLYDRLLADFEGACEDMKAGRRESKAVYDCVYLTLALTGVVSGLARGSNQTAVAHKIYESGRSLFPEALRTHLHGEVVAVGLIAQLAYNGQTEAAVRFREKMQSLGMKTSLFAMGVAPTEENRTLLYEKMLASTAMAGTSTEEHRQLDFALRMIL